MNDRNAYTRKGNQGTEWRNQKRDKVFNDLFSRTVSKISNSLERSSTG